MKKRISNIEQGMSNYEVERFAVGGSLRLRFEEYFVLGKSRMKERILNQILFFGKDSAKRMIRIVKRIDRSSESGLFRSFDIRYSLFDILRFAFVIHLTP